MLEVRDVSVAFGDTVALKNFGLKMKEGEVMGVLGPSGCGKTTLLRVVAGLQPADSGDVLWGEESVLEVPPHRRGFGLMFQDFSLFPHRSVGGNVAFGLRMAGLPAERVAARVSEVLDWVGLEGYEERAVAPISGRGTPGTVAQSRSHRCLRYSRSGRSLLRSGSGGSDETGKGGATGASGGGLAPAGGRVGGPLLGSGRGGGG